jgi:hypothetical protein
MKWCTHDDTISEVVDLWTRDGGRSYEVTLCVVYDIFLLLLVTRWCVCLVSQSLPQSYNGACPHIVLYPVVFNLVKKLSQTGYKSPDGDMVTSAELEGMWKRAVVACFEARSRNWPKGSEKKNITSTCYIRMPLVRELNSWTSEYEPWMLTTLQRRKLCILL